jgi:phage-related protein
MKAIRFHARVLKDMQDLDMTLRLKIADFLALLASGESIGLPASRPMVSVGTGAHELRVKDHTGQYRVFYFTKHKEAILVFHMFKKKTQATPKDEIKIAQKRLEEMQ